MDDTNPYVSPEVAGEEESETVPLKDGEGFVRPAVGCALVVAWNLALAGLIWFERMLEASGISFDLAICLLAVSIPLLGVATLTSPPFCRFVFKPGAPLKEVRRRTWRMTLLWIGILGIAFGAILWR
jgi:hypothetical protein